MIWVRIFGIKWQFSFWFVALITFLLLVDQTGVMLFGILAAIIHEAGHVLFLCCYHKKPKLLSFEITGIRLVENRYGLGMWGELIVLLAGCLFNFIVCVIAMRAGNLFLATTNLCVGIFNLLPGETLDGGRALHLILLHLTSLRVANLVVRIISAVVACCFIFCGTVLLWRGGNPTLLIVGVYLIISMWIKK